MKWSKATILDRGRSKRPRTQGTRSAHTAHTQPSTQPRTQLHGPPVEHSVWDSFNTSTRTHIAKAIREIPQQRIPNSCCEVLKCMDLYMDPYMDPYMDLYMDLSMDPYMDSM
jgi:hypothetical protein